jgi:hypothetical protein
LVEKPDPPTLASSMPKAWTSDSVALEIVSSLPAGWKERDDVLDRDRARVAHLQAVL